MLDRKGGKQMERKLVKAGLYSLILALLFAVIYYPDIQPIAIGNGSFSSTELSMREYLFKIIRFSIKISLATLVVVWIWELKKLPGSKGYDFIGGFIKSFVVSLVLFVFIFWIIGMISHR
jgi:hypothetical protein